MKSIRIVGARQHNLKNLTLEIPRDQLVVVTGVSGSGKTSLAFDTLYAEGQRRYVESLSAQAQMSIERMDGFTAFWKKFPFAYRASLMYPMTLPEQSPH